MTYRYERDDDKKKDEGSSCHVSIMRGVQDWGEKTTLHGLPAVFSPNSSLLRRLFWMCVLLGSIFALQWGYRWQIHRYKEYRAVTKDTIRHEDTLTFPAVTICSNSLMRNNSFTDETERQLVMDIQSGTNVTEMINRYGREYLSRIHVEDMYHKHTVPYKEMVQECQWARQGLDCSRHIADRKLNNQHCYTFNGGENHQPVVTTSSVGSDNGLYMILFANQDNYFLAENNNAGFRILIHDQDQEPDMKRSTYLSPGFSYYLALSKEETILMPNLVKSLGDESCLQTKNDGPPGKSRLKHFHKYSLSACEMECLGNFVYNICGCGHLLHRDQGRPCDLLESVACAYPKEAEFHRESARHMSHCGCPLPCNFTTYPTKLSFSYFPNNNFLRQNGDRLKAENLDIEYVRANYLSVNIFYETKVITTREQILEFPMPDLMASLSGYLGLAVGASALTGVEFVELMLLSMFRLITRR